MSDLGNLRVQPGMQPGLNEGARKVGAGSQDFGDLIKKAINHVSDMETKADQSVERLLKGEAGVHETMMAIQKADISMRLLLQVRNKVMEAYREVMRMSF